MYIFAKIVYYSIIRMNLKGCNILLIHAYFSDYNIVSVGGATIPCRLERTCT